MTDLTFSQWRWWRLKSSWTTQTLKMKTACSSETMVTIHAALYQMNWFLNITRVYIYIYIYVGCPWGNVPDFGRMFFKLKYTYITKNTYIRSWKVTEIMAREKCSLLAVPRTVPGLCDILPIHCACPSFSLQPAEAHSRCDCTCKVLGTLRTTMPWVRVFL